MFIPSFIFLFYYRSSVAVGFAIYYAQYFAAKYLFVSKDGALIDNRFVATYVHNVYCIVKSLGE